MSFDTESWNLGYRKGFHEGVDHGEALGEQSLRDRLSRRLSLLKHDVRLGLPAIESPLEVIREVELLVLDRQGDCHGSRD